LFILFFLIGLSLFVPLKHPFFMVSTSSEQQRLISLSDLNSPSSIVSSSKTRTFLVSSNKSLKLSVDVSIDKLCWLGVF